MTPLERSKSRVSVFLKLSSERLPKHKLIFTLTLPSSITAPQSGELS
jgi:hypothetical protein